MLINVETSISTLKRVVISSIGVIGSVTFVFVGDQVFAVSD
jgi:hypothetical protein